MFASVSTQDGTRNSFAGLSINLQEYRSASDKIQQIRTPAQAEKKVQATDDDSGHQLVGSGPRSKSHFIQVEIFLIAERNEIGSMYTTVSARASR